MRQIIILMLALCLPSVVSAQSGKAPHPSMIEDSDGELGPNEYIVISSNGSITRAHCPYTCEMRGIPAEHCKTWNSVTNNLCYVQDLRIPSDAMPEDTSHEVVKSNEGYR